MGPSLVELQAAPSVGPSTVQAVRSAWRAVGPAGRVLAVGAVVGGLLVSAWWLPSSPAAVATGLALVVLAVAALVDAAVHRLPDALTATALAPIVAAVAAAWSGDLLRAALAGAALVGLPLLAAHLLSPEAMGFGDVKAGTVLGAAIGLLLGPMALLALVLGLLLAAVLGLARHATAVALGPPLVAGAVLALAVARLAGL